MDGALDGVVAPPSQQVTRVDDNSPLDGRRVDKLAGRALDLQSTPVILEEQRDGAIVLPFVSETQGSTGSYVTHTMRTGPHSIRIDLENIAIDSRVVQQPQRVVPDVDKLVKKAVAQPHTHRNGPHDFNVHILAHAKEPQHILLEAIDIFGLPLLGPLIWVLRLSLASDLVALLEIRRCTALLTDIAQIHLLRDLLAAGGRIAAVGLGRGPANAQLVIVGLGEEVGGTGEGVAEDIGRDGVVLEVDEAGALEAAEDRVGCLLALVRGAVEELGEVDELGGVLVGMYP